MSSQRLASRTRRARNKGGTKAQPAEHACGVPIPEGLHEAIETERGDLSKADSVLGCLVIAMEYDTDSVDKPYYPDVAQLAREMVRRSINGLDCLTLQQKLLRNKVKESFDASYSEGTVSLPGIPRKRHVASVTPIDRSCWQLPRDWPGPASPGACRQKPMLRSAGIRRLEDRCPPTRHTAPTADRRPSESPSGC